MAPFVTLVFPITSQTSPTSLGWGAGELVPLYSEGMGVFTFYHFGGQAISYKLNMAHYGYMQL